MEDNDVAVAPVTPDFRSQPATQTSLIAGRTRAASSDALAPSRDGARDPPAMRNLLELRARHRLDRQARETQQRHLFQLRVALDLVERHRPRQRFLRRKIHRAPIAFLRGGVRIRFPDDFRDPDDGLVRSRCDKKGPRRLFASRADYFAPCNCARRSRPSCHPRRNSPTNRRTVPDFTSQNFFTLV